MICLKILRIYVATVLPQETLGAVDQRISIMAQYQYNSKAREARDYQLLLDNNSWVQAWSIGLCLALVTASMGQV